MPLWWPSATSAGAGLAGRWLATLIGAVAIGSAVGVLGPLAAVVGVAGAAAVLTGAWVLAVPLRAVTLYAFLLPFDVYLSTSLRVTSTQLFQTLVLLATGLGMLLFRGTARRPARIPGSLVPLGICLIAYLMLSITWSLSPEASARSLLRTVAAMMMAALAASVIRDRATLRQVLAAAGFGALLTSLYGYAQFIRGGYDPLYQYFSPFYNETFAARGAGFSIVATFSNPNILAGYGTMMLPLVWALAVDARHARRAGWIAVGVLVSGAMLLTFSKTGWLLVAFLASCWMLARVSPGTRLAAAGGGGIALGVVVLLIDRLLTTFSVVFPNAREMSVDSRLGLWRVSLSAFSESPLIGFGLDGFAAATVGLRTATLADLVRAHNIYLQTLVDIGIVGTVLFWTPLLIVYGAGVKALLADARPDRAPLHMGLVLSATGFLLFGLVESLNVSNNYVNAYWLVFGLLSASTQLRDGTPAAAETQS